MAPLNLHKVRERGEGVGLGTDLFDLGEQALSHFCAGTCDKDCAVWIEADEGGPRTCRSVQQSLESVQFSHVVGGSLRQFWLAPCRVGLVKATWPTCACSTGVQLSIQYAPEECTSEHREKNCDLH